MLLSKVSLLMRQALTKFSCCKWDLSTKVASPDRTRPIPRMEQCETETAYREGLSIPRTSPLPTAVAELIMPTVRSFAKFYKQAWPVPPDYAEQWRRSFISMMSQEFPNGDFENWAKCEQLLPYVEMLSDTRPSTVELAIAWAQTLSNAGWYLWKIGRYDMAQDYLSKALAVMELFPGPHDERTLSSVDIMAGILSSQGKYDLAEELHQRALRGFEKKLGRYHSYTLTSMSNLALVQQHQGRYQDARKLQQQALERSEAVLGQGHADTLTSVSNLALVLYHQGRYDEAMQLNVRAFEGFKEMFGLLHPSTLTSASNLASVLRHQGKVREAEELSWLALAGKMELLGSHHPSTEASAKDLVWALQVQGKGCIAGQL